MNMDNIELNAKGEWSFAFTGSRAAIWHRKGTELPADATIEQWKAAAGLTYRVIKVPAFACMPCEGMIAGEMMSTPFEFLVREDTKKVFAPCTPMFKVEGVQPGDVADWFDKYVAHDSRFHIDAAGVLGGGERVWMTARFDSDLTVAGDRHVPRALMSTAFDGSMATINQATVERAVCQNTLRIAWSDKRAVIKTSHRSTFDGKRVARELSQIAATFNTYKAMGDALAQITLGRDAVLKFFGAVLDIPEGSKRSDKGDGAVSTRKWNQLDDLATAWGVTWQERGNSSDAFTALQAVTRYCDHDRNVRNASDDDIGRFDSATFGSGDQMKGKALGVLMPMLPIQFRDKVLIPA